MDEVSVQSRESQNVHKAGILGGKDREIAMYRDYPYGIK